MPIGHVCAPTEPEKAKPKCPPQDPDEAYRTHCCCWWDSGGDDPGPVLPCCRCGNNGEEETPCPWPAVEPDCECGLIPAHPVSAHAIHPEIPLPTEPEKAHEGHGRSSASAIQVVE